MILIADGGSTKVDWIVLDNAKKEVFSVTTAGLNPSILSKNDLEKRILTTKLLVEIKDTITEIHFYGAGCNGSTAVNKFKNVLQIVFCNAVICIKEDIMAAVYASCGNTPGIVCILGTGSNSCYFDGEKASKNNVSLGYVLMDEASGNYFGKELLRDYFYGKMPKIIALAFENKFNLAPDFIKTNLYLKESPNMFLASFAEFMFDYVSNKYIENLLEKGFQLFLENWVLSYNKPKNTPVYFIGSIAYFFSDILNKVAIENNLEIKNIIRRPIDNLVKYHQTN